MAKWIAIFDTWLIMAITVFFAGLGLTTVDGLSKGYASLFWQEAILYLVEAGLALWLSAWIIRRGGSGTWLRLLMIIAMAGILWLPPTRWFALNDNALVRGGSFQHEFMLQRLEQVGQFSMFAVPFVVLGIVRGRLRAAARASGSHSANERLLSLRLLVVIVLGAGVLSRVLDMSDPNRTLQPLLVGVGSLVIVFEFARRAVWGDRGVIPALAAIAIGLPIVSFWQF